MTTIIKAGSYSVENETQQIVIASAGKALICLSKLSVKRHLKCYTQTWVVKSAFGQQLFGDYHLAASYYSRLPDSQIG